MFKSTYAFSLIEFLLTLSILWALTLVTLPLLNNFIQKQQALNTMHKIQQILRLARSLAIVKNSQITLCASSNGYSCNQTWQGILLRTDAGISTYFSLGLNRNYMLSLLQSGKTTNRVEIQANGMANSNGHFIYKSLKASNNTQLNLYFNKALKTYMLVDG